MWITRFKADSLSPNYQNVDLEFAPVNVFLGRNNSGKSRLLQTLLQEVSKQTGSNDKRIDPSLASNPEIIYSEELPTPQKSQMPPFRYIPVDRTPNYTLNTQMFHTNNSPTGQGVSDILEQLHEYPLLRPKLQFEIERLLGVSFAFEYQERSFVWHVVDNSPSPSPSPSPKVTLHQHGRGVQYYVTLFFYLYHPDIKVLFIDEPENSLHPQLQRALIDRIREIACKEGKQVFLSTHSPLFALPDTVDDFKGIFLLQRYHTPPQILSLSSLVPSTSEERHRFDSFLPNFDPSITELFFATGGLIVEGQTERYFMQYIANRTGRDFHQHEITIIESNGLGLMPSLIRVAQPILQHWRAFCDNDLLYKPGAKFEGFRKDMETTLGIPIPKKKSEDEKGLTEIRAALKAKGLYVLPEDGLEHYFKSPTAISYFEDRAESIDAKDKGWLLAEEIRFLNEQTSEFIEITYADLVEPLDEIMTVVKKTMFKAHTMDQLVRDVLFNDANTIHCQAYRQQWNEELFRQFLSQTKALNAYDLKFHSFQHYELYWKDPVGGIYRIRCEGINFFVEHENQSDGIYKGLRQGTVGV